MDIFSHGLWAAAAAKLYNKRKNRGAQKREEAPGRLRPWAAAFWGISPDLLAFTGFFLWFAVKILGGELTFADIPSHDRVEPMSPDTIPIMRITHALYSVSHSAVIFALVFAAVFLVVKLAKKRVPWEMGGWLIHILIDLPTHTYRYFPTPVLWPISGWRFDGVPWAEPWFLVVNYLAIIAVFAFLRRKRGTASASESAAQEKPSIAFAAEAAE